MEPTIPSFLEVRSPTGRRWTFGLPLDQDRVIVGRLHAGPDQCDIHLGPDVNELISREHCAFVRRNAKWYLSQIGKNCSWLRAKPEMQKGEIEVKPGEEVLLADGDLVRIRGEISQRGHLYWEIRFWDRETTKSPSILSLRYDKRQKELFFVKEGKEREVHLTPYERKFVDFMLGQRQSGAICTHEELLAEVWGLDGNKDRLHQLIRGLRDKLEPIPHKTCFLISHASQGYSLHTQPVD